VTGVQTCAFRSQETEAVRRDEKALIHTLTGIEPRHTVMLNQVHGDAIVALDGYPGEDLPWIGEADGLVTTLPGLCLVIRTADCVPVFAFDAARRVLGAVHSGWRGCRLGIAQKLIELMTRRYGSKPEDIRVAVLPAIGPHSYTVGEEVAAHFPGAASRRDGQIYLDLVKTIADPLVAMGVPRSGISTPTRCTMKDNGALFSHRMGDKGRNLNFGYIL
jgi:YfiH family protein